MIPLTLLTANKAARLLTYNSALESAVKVVAAATGQVLPAIQNSQITFTSVSAGMADQNAQLTYPRVCLFCTQARNSNRQKFRTFSGSIALVAEVWHSADLLEPTEYGLHSYVQAVTSVFAANQGDWGDGIYFAGSYDIQFQPVHAGGFGFVQSARIVCSVDGDVN